MNTPEQIDLHDPEDLRRLALEVGSQCSLMLIQLLRVIPAEHRVKFCGEFIACPVGTMVAATSPEEVKVMLDATKKVIDLGEECVKAARH